MFLASIDKFNAMLSKGNIYAPDGNISSWTHFLDGLRCQCSYIIVILGVFIMFV